MRSSATIPGSAVRTAPRTAPGAGQRFESHEHTAARLADAVARRARFDNLFGCNAILIARTHVAVLELYGSLSLRIASLRYAQEAVGLEADKALIEQQLIRPLKLEQVRWLFSRRRSAPVLRFRLELRGNCYGHGRLPPSSHCPIRHRVCRNSSPSSIPARGCPIRSIRCARPMHASRRPPRQGLPSLARCLPPPPRPHRLFCWPCTCRLCLRRSIKTRAVVPAVRI